MVEIRPKSRFVVLRPSYSTHAQPAVSSRSCYSFLAPCYCPVPDGMKNSLHGVLLHSVIHMACFSTSVSRADRLPDLVLFSSFTSFFLQVQLLDRMFLHCLRRFTVCVNEEDLTCDGHASLVQSYSQVFSSGSFLNFFLNNPPVMPKYRDTEILLLQCDSCLYNA
jgi:hypothetical protein